MGNQRVAALATERQAVLEFCRSLSPEEWESPSSCAGWTVKNVVSHMGAAFHGAFTPWLIKLMRTKDLERSSDGDVAKRSGWEPAKVLSEYEAWSRRYLKAQPAFKPVGSIKIPLGELGRYPLSIFPAAFTFDHHTHLRHDMAEALGRPQPPTDEARMAVALDWMTYGIPQMCRQAMSAVDRPVDLTLHGPGGATWSFVPSPSGRLELRAGGAGTPAATIVGQSLEFPLWGTKRRPWRELDVTVDGDVVLGTKFLEALNVV